MALLNSDRDRYAGMTLQYIGTEELKLNSGGSMEIADRRHPIFGFALKGNAKVTLRRDNRSRSGKVLSGELFYMPTGARCTIENVDTGTFHAVWIRFVRDRNPHIPSSFAAEEEAPGDFELYSFRVPQIRGWISDFLGDGGDSEPAVFYQLQSHLYAIASAFVSHTQKPKGADDELVGYVERTKRYMLEHYADPIDVEELAHQSGASSGRFYQAFRKHTGLSPHKFMTTVRLNVSLGMLAHSGVSIAEVAHSTGYSDELYFSRLFKKHMGMSPTEYASCANKKIVMPPIFVGDLSVLGITPEWVLDRGWSDNPDEYVRMLADSRPELILTSPIPDELRLTLSEIAPVVSLHWKEYPWKERLLEISELLGISSVAERWLAFYDRKVENARQQVRRHLGDTPFLLASSFGERFRVYGMQMNKVKDLFYDDLQVTQPEQAHKFGLLEVGTVREIAELDCDHLLLLMPIARSDESIAALEEEWRTHKPNRPARCFVIRYEEPLMYNASMYESLIDQTVNLLLQKESPRKVHG
ncbi:MAG: AraC family transcriptional regulator [Paenibacillus sp.]|nr:AraC family transcriptional regulator [Paenibacillus sp.]